MRKAGMKDDTCDFSFWYKAEKEFTKKLLEIRRKWILKGGRLLSADGIEDEVRIRRTGNLHNKED